MAASSSGAWSSESRDVDDLLQERFWTKDPKGLGLEGIDGKLSGTFRHLGGESVLEELRILMPAGLDEKSATILAERSLAKNGTLKTLELWLNGGIATSAAAILGKMLGENSTLQDLLISTPDLGGEGLEYLLEPLMRNEAGHQSNSSLKRLHITGASSAAMLGTMLAENSTIEELEVWAPRFGGEGMEYLLKPLMKNEAGQQPNSSLKHLLIARRWIGSRGAAVVAETLSQNHTLIFFSLFLTTLEPEDWCQILKSLEGNTSLEKLDLQYCKGLGSNEVQAVFMDLVGKFNHTLRTIDLDETDIPDSYAIYSQLRRNRWVAEYKDWMKELNTIPPMFARVFLCGNTLAGKSTLRTSMIRSLVRKPRKRVGLKIQAHAEAVRDSLRSVKDPEEWARRTRGIKIEVLSNGGECVVSLWDLAGQEEYQAFHDFMIPDFSDGGSSSSFVLLCSPFVKLSDEEKDICDIEKELCHWMRFIASNTRRSVIARPHVIVVITRMDKGYEHIETIKRCVGKLRRKFEDFIEVCSEVHFLCASSFASKEVEKLVKVIQSTCGEQLRKLPEVYEACVRMQKDVCEWNHAHPEEPLIDQKKFKDVTRESLGLPSKLWEKGVKEYKEIEEIRSAVACSLHEAGEIVYFKDESFVVVNPGWFCHEVMGQIIQLPKLIAGTRSASSEFKEGVVEKAKLEVMLRRCLKHTPTMQNWSSSVTSELIGSVIQLMVRLKLCYEVGLERENVFIPVTLIDDDAQRIAKGERKLEFEMEMRDASYLGRRLQCVEPEVTSLTPGFFPKLQVELHNYFTQELQKELPAEVRFYNKKNLMRIILVEMEILVELSGETMAVSFIDILVGSSKPESYTLEFVQKHVVCKILELCYSPGGCQGVSLQEAVLQTKCVEELLPLKHRICQAVLVDTLKARFEGDGDYKHLWGEVKEGDRVILEWEWESAWVLLGEKVCKQILRSKQRGLDLGDLTVDSLGPAVKPNSGSLRQFSSDLSKLSVATSSNADNRGQIIDPMLGSEMLRKLDLLLDFTIGIRERQCPCYVYFTDPKVAHRLMVKLLPQHTALRLHFLCEHVDACHVVDEQEGVGVNFAPEQVKKVVGPLILGTFASLTGALKMTAHLAGGMGDLVPNIGSGVALKYDCHTLLDYFRKEVSSTPGNAQNKRGAEQWLVDFLKGKSMGSDFGLVRVRYLKDNKIRWVCRDHRDEGYKNDTLLEIPVSGRT